MKLFKFITAAKKVNVHFLIRATQLIILFFAILLILVGQGVCIFYSASEMRPPECKPFRLSVDSWHMAEGKWVNAQYGIVAVGIIIFFLKIQSIRKALAKNYERTIVDYASIGCTLILGGVEAGFAAHAYKDAYKLRGTLTKVDTNGTGNPMRQLSIDHSYVESWVASSILFFVLFFLGILDVTHKSDKMKEQELAKEKGEKVNKGGGSSLVTDLIVKPATAVIDKLTKPAEPVKPVSPKEETSKTSVSSKTSTSKATESPESPEK